MATLILGAAQMSDGKAIPGAAFRITPLAAVDSAPRQWIRADRDSMTTLRIESMRPGSYVVAARGLGYALRTDTVEVSGGMEVTITLTMNDAYLGIRCSPPLYRRSGESACVGLEAPEAREWMREARRYAEPRRDPLEGLAPFQAHEIALVTDEGVCERAAREYGGPGSPPRRVVVVRLGTAGYIVEDPFEPHRAGEFSVTTIFDAHWRVLVHLAS